MPTAYIYECPVFPSISRTLHEEKLCSAALPGCQHSVARREGVNQGSGSQKLSQWRALEHAASCLPAMEFLSCSELREFVCILCTAAQSLLLESCCEKGQSPAEMKECEALVEPPLAFTPLKKNNRKTEKETHSRAFFFFFAENSANKLFLNKRQDGGNPTVLGEAAEELSLTHLLQVPRRQEPRQR